MRGLLRHIVILAGLPCLLGSFSGCADGPFYKMYYQKQWQADEKYGPTFHTKLGDLRSLRKNAKQLSPQEQLRYAIEINRVLPTDPSPVYRGELVRVLAEFTVPEARDGLRIAIKDDEKSVRVLACEAWGGLGDEESLQILREVVGSDSDLDVRMAATRQLANFRSTSAVQALGIALDDPDPALQYRAVQSLKSITGKDFGNSVPAWRQYVQGGNPLPEKQPSLVQRFRELF